MLEQFHPTEVLELSAYAESQGFSGVMAADHFQPWVPQQGQAAFVWNVLSALGQVTTGDIGPGVTAPSFRWHPAMVAQASATLAAMYPGRHWLGLGAGEALNEHIDRRLLAGGSRAAQHDVRGDRGDQEAVRRLAGRQGRQAPRGVLQARVHPAVDHAGRGPTDLHRDRRSGHRPAGREDRRRADHRRCATGEDRGPVRQVRPGRTRVGPRAGQSAQDPPAAHVVGRHRRGCADQRHGGVAERRDEVPEGATSARRSSSSRWPSSSERRTSRAGW